MILKSRAFVALVISSTLFTSGFSYPIQGHQVQGEENANGLREFVAIILREEINMAIKKEYGTNWLFQLEDVCENDGKKIKIEGVLNKNRGSKRIVLNFEKSNSGYELMNISEIN
ncbi:hypothetical protein ACF3MZ_26230 [Paenibacillaceae bacterium WGS1546]|uniref:hypothetical protein n=1 Tax=Cohnella sp. WGS1546 TaxID=3366810 RepID=UPI00372CFC58